jgi:protein involved in polysaccharide export with SLBB domain
MSKREARLIPIVLPALLVAAFAWPDVAGGQGKADRIQPGDRLFIHVANTLPGYPIHAVYRVEPSGKVALGPVYGRVAVAGGSLEDAEAKIQAHLGEIFRNPYASVTRYDPVANGGGGPDPVLALERRVQQLEEELRELRAALDALRKPKRE